MSICDRVVGADEPSMSGRMDDGTGATSQVAGRNRRTTRPGSVRAPSVKLSGGQRVAVAIISAGRSLAKLPTLHCLMRLWTVHPRHLDGVGLVALWREA